MDSKVVSLIVPCYNGEKYIDTCIDSILSQTYKNIELILVNDGSTDNSEVCILNRKNELEDQLFKFQYIVQKNQGVGGAINTGLKYVSGEYLTMLDIDDFIMRESIEKKVSWLEEHTEHTAVLTNGYYVSEINKLKEEKLFYLIDFQMPEDIFSEIIRGSVRNWPGSYMVRTENWDKHCKNREIFCSRNGQNMQILLPALYKQKGGYISEPLMQYLKHEGSLSSSKDIEKAIQNTYEYQEIYNYVIESLTDGEELGKYKHQVDITFSNARYWLAIENTNKKYAKIFLKELKQNKIMTLDTRLSYLQVFHYTMYRIIMRMKILIERRHK